MKQYLIMFFLFITSLAQSVEVEQANHLDVKVTRLGPVFQVNVSYQVALDACNAFAFITDYENAKKISGIKESKIISRNGNKILVDRLIEDRILGFPVDLSSVEEFTEISKQKLIFEQVRGDAKFYRGSWTLIPLENATKFVYESQFELDTFIPNAVINYFIKNTSQMRFEQMVQQAKSVETHPYSICP
jgi:ribosome-associated toxin RatA of RatAB toxin-antitoxin module